MCSGLLITLAALLQFVVISLVPEAQSLAEYVKRDLIGAE